MATITATITVDFDANYAGDHRACFRIQGSGDPYDCTTIVNCVGGGATCQAIMTADVNDTSCDGIVTFEGYIQSACESEESINGRLPFLTTFTPDVDCHRTEITCDYAGIGAINITDNGKDYTGVDVVMISRAFGDTQTLDATFSLGPIGTGVINSIGSLTNPGLNYIALEVLTIVGSEAGAGGSIRIDTVGGSGEILTYTLLTAGIGYQGTISVTGGSGTSAAFSIQPFGVDFDEDGAVTSIIISTPGLYDSPPDITVTGSGTEFTATVSLANCAVIVPPIGLDCTGGSITLPLGIPHGDTFAVCVDDTGLSGLTPDYSSVEAGCCITTDSVNDTCYTYNIANATAGAVTINYTACNSGGIVSFLLGPSANMDVCAVIGSVQDPNIAGIVVTTAGVLC